jgi:aminopeptidase 2
MLSDYVGEEKFLKGVSLYLKNHLFANTVTNDLWKGISEATGTFESFRTNRILKPAGVDVVRLMDNWITKVGSLSVQNVA